MGEQFGQRYPNGTPLQGAAMHLSSQNMQGSYKPPVMSNGQPYQPQNPPAASFPNPPRPIYSHMNPPQPQAAPPGSAPLRPTQTPHHQPVYPQSIPPLQVQNTAGQSLPSTVGQSSNQPGVNYNGYRPPPAMAPGNKPISAPSYGIQNTGNNYRPPAQSNVASHTHYQPQMPNTAFSGPPITAPSPAFDNKVPQNLARPAAPQYPNSYSSPSQAGLVPGMERLSVAQQGFNKLWGTENIDLLQRMNILPPHKITPPAIRFTHEFVNSVNCNQDIFCCTLNKIPENNSLLQKSRLPLGVLIHPFRDLTELPVIQCSSIVRCRACRTYINPFVYFLDNKRWKCNLCFRVNELPDEFQFDPVSRTYGDPSRRPEIKSCTIEFIAPSEYMLRPPQPAIYLFLLDISRWGCDSGYLEAFCDVMADELDSLPGDARTQVGFILFDSYLHFFSIPDGANQARELIVTDIEDIFLPMPDSLLVNLQENKAAIRDLLLELPKRFAQSFDIGSALGPALQAAHKLMSPTGGRVSVFQCSLPSKGPGLLNTRDSSGDSDKDAAKLNPQTDFYKRLALDCAQQQVAVDIFLLNSMYADLATVGGIAQFSGGCVHHFSGYRRENIDASEKMTRTLRRYLTRKIGFEAVMRVRCSRGLAIHTFHGNFFVRSTDLLSLPNVNPDAGFGMQVTIEDSLSELNSVCFQAALLYTSAKGERRIRVHTICLPVTSNLSEIMTSANQQAIIGLLSKMAVDRSLKSNLSDAREAYINASIDILSAFKLIDGSRGPGLMAPSNLSLIPLYILALLKSVAFRSGATTRLDDRMFAMLQMKNLPLRELIQTIHPDLYNVTTLDEEADGSGNVATPNRLSLSLQYIDSRCAYILDTPDAIYLLIGEHISAGFLADVLGVQDIRSLALDMVDLPDVDSIANERLRTFINNLQLEKPCAVILKVFTQVKQYANYFIMDKTENSLSYHELLNHIKNQVK